MTKAAIPTSKNIYDIQDYVKNVALIKIYDLFIKFYCIFKNTMVKYSYFNY